ncbi:MAG: hypothetical protein K5673_08445 [Lachnospiraceae bacterium]|nr:hypothetical protein [Lachnospiraceae bacterium]
MIVSINAKDLPPISEEEKKAIKEAVNKPIEYDDDCPELSDEQLSRFVRAADYTREEIKQMSLAAK